MKKILLITLLITTINASGFEEITKACDKGNMDSCYNLAVMYDRGIKIKINKKKAKKLYKRVCDVGDLEGCNNLGLIYYNENDKGKAREIFEKTCNAQNMAGCKNLGSMYATGNGVKANKLTANKLFDKACNLGEGSSCFNLGLDYVKGDGVKQDKITAKDYFRKACKSGYTQGCKLYNTLNNPVQEFTKGCDAGNIEYCYNLAKMYRQGEIAQQDDKKAKSFYNKACENGHKPGCFELGYFYGK